MKGDVSPVIYLVLAIVLVGIVLFFLLQRFGPSSIQMSVGECKQKMQDACGSFRSTGNPAVFNGIPQTCADSLGVSSLFKACVSGTTDQCKSLCESVEIGVVTPQGGGEIPSPPTPPPIGQ